MPITDFGATNTTALITPGALVQRVSPPVETLSGVPSDIGGVVGTASYGPVNVAVSVASYKDYVATFGDLDNAKFDAGTVVATSVQNGATDLRVVRVTDGTDTSAKANAITVTGNTTVTGATITSIYTGSEGNRISVTIGTGSKANTNRVVISRPGVVDEVYDNLDASSGTAFWAALDDATLNGTAARGKSNMVRAVKGSSTALPTVRYTVTLTGGTDGASSANAATLVGVNGATRTGMYALDETGISAFVLAGVDDSSTFTTQDGFARKQPALAIMTGPSNDTIANAITTKRTAGLDSYQSKLLFGDYLLWNDPINSTARYVSPQGFYLGARLRLSPNKSTLNATGGQFPLQSIVGSQKVGKYTQSETDQLIKAGIDVIGNPSPGGDYWSVLGGVTTSSNPAEVDEANTTMGNFLNSTLDKGGTGRFIGVEVTDDTMDDVSATLNNLLSSMLSSKMLSKHNGKLPWTVVCSIENNPDNLLGLGYVQADVKVRFNGTLRHLILNTLGGSTVQPN